MTKVEEHGKKIDTGLHKGYKGAFSYRIYDKKWTKVENKTKVEKSVRK